MDKKIWYAPNKFESYGDSEINAVNNCLKDGWLAGFGPKTIEFEQKIAELFNKKYGVFVNSGSSANLLALASLNLPRKTKVLTPACTFSTTVAPIVQLGLKPVFCDVGLTNYVAEVSDIMRYIHHDINKEIKVIMLPNLIGIKPYWMKLKSQLVLFGREDIILIEDSCDTITSTFESDISTTSFYASHIITAGGSGGMVMFNDEKLRDRALQYRDWGRMGDNSEDMGDRFNYSVDGIPYDYKFLYGVLGYNFKGSEMNAAFGLAQLNKLEQFIDIRKNNIKRYKDNLSSIEQILLPTNSTTDNLLAMPLQCENRLKLLNYLEEHNIQTRVTFAGNITRHPAYRKYLQPFNNADIIMKNGFLLGAHHGMTLEDVDYVTDTIKEFYAK
jgi:CDP-6-deoxy-D-xylo-4-hexulose-3-dehydrase